MGYVATRVALAVRKSRVRRASRNGSGPDGWMDQ